MTTDNMHLQDGPCYCERITPDDLYLFASSGCNEAEILAYAEPMTWTQKQAFRAVVRFVVAEVRAG